MATRPRDVRASSPARTRNGSATSSTVSALLADGHRQRGDTHRPAAEAATQGVEDGPVEPVEAQVVDVVEGQRPGRDLPGDDAVGLDLGVVADPPQQPVGDPGGAPGPTGDLGRPLGRERHIEQRGGAVQDALQLCDLVEVQVGR